MPRNHNAGPSTLRNRNRVTNKTRLKVIRESIDADPIFTDDDEEKARVVSTAGVDAEDANEHHLQAVLSAAAYRHHNAARSRTTTSAPDNKEASGSSGGGGGSSNNNNNNSNTNSTSTAYIPTPDSTGKVENYAELYPSERWRDPITYVKTSDTVEEAITNSLYGGFVYYMDERDKEWLDKNNEEARGEGTSAQGAVMSTTRSGRSARKGKEPVEGPQPVVMSEDEFELVMAIFEKVTHEKTPFLHHALEQSSSTPFPPFSEYQDAFVEPLSPLLFALAVAPSLSSSGQLLKFAKAAYPHWSKRRQERGGHTIIPVVDLDETDNKNESYICFRRREIKAVRKTRAQQATFSDKMQRLQTEMINAYDIARNVVMRETMKKEAALHGQVLADARLKLVDLKRKFPGLGIKEDEELFYDKERVAKKVKVEAAGRIPLHKVRARENGEFSPAAQEPLMRPRDRRDMILKQVDDELAKRKEKDHHWEDLVDSPYQPTPTTYASRLWRAVAESRSSANSDSSNSHSTTQRHRAARLRYGRGGRIHLDRRLFSPRGLLSPPSDEEDDATRDRLRRLQSQWRFDEDDIPAVGWKGVDEHDRKLVDDYDLPYLPYSMTLLSGHDHHLLTTDPTLTILGSDGRPIQHLPFKLGAPARPEPIPGARPSPGSASTSSTPSVAGTPRQPNGTPAPATPTPNGTGIPVPLQVKGVQPNMPPPAGVPQTRVPSGGIIRPPSVPIPPIATPKLASQTSPQAAPSTTLFVNSVSDALGPSQIQSEGEVKLMVPIKSNGIPHDISQPQTPEIHVSPAPASISPTRPKSQNQHPIPVTNNFQFPVNGYPTHLATTPSYAHPSIRSNGINTAQQLQALKTTTPFAGMTVPHEMTTQVSTQQHMRAQYMAAAAGNTNYSAQVAAAAARQMQWVAAVTAAQQQQQVQQQQLHQQRPPTVNVMDTDVDMAAVLLSPPPLATTPTRVPSANGIRPTTSLKPGMVTPSVGHPISPSPGRVSPGIIPRMAPHGHTSPHLVSASLAAAQQAAAASQSSPTRTAQTALPSPSLQTRQAVGGSGAVGY